jgi:hypothetical protein
MLCNEQHAYRKSRSCYTALVELTNYLYTAIDKPCGKAIAVYFDAKKAFDGINRNLLIQKLMNNYNLEPMYVNLFLDYFMDRKIKIKNGNQYFNNDMGVSQGASIAGMLFSMFLNDICNVIYMPFLLYSDDLVVYSSGINVDVMMHEMKKQVCIIKTWYNDNSININYEKTVFSKARDWFGGGAAPDK